jgi:hypothetical protein
MPEQPGRRRMLSCQRIRGALEVETVVCLSKTVLGPRLGRSYLVVFAAAAWLIFGMATLESPIENVCAQPKAANTCFCELSSTVSQAYCWGKSGHCGRADRAIRQSGAKSRVLIRLQRRSRACRLRSSLIGRNHGIPIQPEPLQKLPQPIRIIDRAAFCAAGAKEGSAGIGDGAAAAAADQQTRQGPANRLLGRRKPRPIRAHVSALYSANSSAMLYEGGLSVTTA